MTITGRTRIFGIIGDPIAHTRSPEMHNAAFDALGLDCRYIPFRVSPADLPDAVRGLRALGIAGFNVTIPHKEEIIPLLDEVTPDASLIGAVNTVVVDGNRLVGHNTDKTGFIQAIVRDLDFIPRGKRILIIGAGGGARSAIVGLAEEGASSIAVTNRAPDRGERLIDSVKDRFIDVDMRTEPYDILGDDLRLSSYDLLVNATPTGLRGERFDQFSPATPLTGYDMVYGDRPTPFVESIRRGGGRAATGEGMLAAQGEEAFFLWTGIRPPANLMSLQLSTPPSDRTRPHEQNW
ncbi:MAG: shikimate dehydrogenase [Desulfuromonadia bacterium]